MIGDQFKIIKQAQSQYVSSTEREDIIKRIEKALVPMLSIPPPEEAERFSNAYISEKENSSMEFSSSENTNTGIASNNSSIDGSKTQDDSQIPEVNQESVEFNWDHDNMGDFNVILSSTQQKAMDYFKKGFSNFSLPGRKN